MRRQSPLRRPSAPSLSSVAPRRDAASPRPGAIGEGGQGHLAKCTEFDEEAFATFRDEFRFKGPERFAPEQLQPGM